MLRLKAVLALLVATSVGGVLGNSYHLTDNISGTGFLSAFTHEAISDPTHGRGNYVTQSTALAQNLTYAHEETFIIRVDSKNKIAANSPGRNTVRLQSKKQYHNHVAVFNIWHMPQGCGTWPAVWEVGANWPNEGEVDIVEGVNDVSPNQSTMHTNAGCSMSNNRPMTGTSTGLNCDVSATGNESCGVKSKSAASYGPAFNAAHGGFYAMERTDSFIKIWFWSRYDKTVPSDVSTGTGTINTDSWGTPFAYFGNSQCNLDAKLGNHNIIINIALCGDWAGSTFGHDNKQCPGSCVDFVNNNPSAFDNAYFDFQWVKVYE